MEEVETRSIFSPPLSLHADVIRAEKYPCCERAAAAPAAGGTDPATWSAGRHATSPATP